MGILGRLFRIDSPEEPQPLPEMEQRGTTSTSRLDLPEDTLLRSFGLMVGGVTVNPDTAMTVSTIYACVRILAESIASLPLKLYQKDGDTRREASDQSVYRLIKEEPNEYQTSFEFREMMQGHLGVRGNAFARIYKGPNGQPVAIEPMHPADVRAKMTDAGLLYHYKGKVLTAYDVLHIKGISSDGIMGLSPISLLRDTVGLALSAQKHGLNTYQNGAKPGGILETPSNLTDDQIKQLREQWERHQGGVGNSGSTAILQGGMKWQSVGFSNIDAQYLEGRKFDVEEIARAFRIPLHLLQSTEKSTSWGTGIEQQNIGFLEYTLRPWLVRWEQSLNRVLLTEAQKANGYYFKFSLDALLRGDFKTRMEGYRTGIESGIYSINEVRRMEDMNPLDGDVGDKHYRPLNTAPADQLPAPEPQPVEVEA